MNLARILSSSLFITLAMGGFSEGRAEAIRSGPGDGPGATLVASESINPDSSFGSINLGSPNEPIEVDYDPAAGPIRKIFDIQVDRDGDGDVDLDDLAIWASLLSNGTLVTSVHEHFIVGAGGPGWRDWHEQIISPDWTWGQNVMFTANGAPIAGLQTMNMGPAIWFVFPEMPAGTRIDIWKELHFSGGLALVQRYFGQIGSPVEILEVIEYPTIPEPVSAMTLLMGAGLLLGGRRRARVA